MQSVLSGFIRRFLEREWLLLDSAQRTRGRTTTRDILFRGQEGHCWRPGRRRAIPARRIRRGFFVCVAVFTSALVLVGVLAGIALKAGFSGPEEDEAAHVVAGHGSQAPDDPRRPAIGGALAETVTPKGSALDTASESPSTSPLAKGWIPTTDAPVVPSETGPPRDVSGTILMVDARRRTLHVFAELDRAVVQLRYDEATKGLQEPSLAFRAGERVALRSSGDGRVESISSVWEPPAAQALAPSSNRVELAAARNAKDLGDSAEIHGRVVGYSPELRRFFLADPSQAFVDWNVMFRPGARLGRTEELQAVQRARDLVYRDAMESPNVTDFLHGYRWHRNELPRTFFFDAETMGREALADGRLVRIQVRFVEPAWAGLYVTNIVQEPDRSGRAPSRKPGASSSSVPDEARTARERWRSGDHEGALAIASDLVHTAARRRGDDRELRALRDERLKLVGGALLPLSSVESFDWYAPLMICQWKQQHGAETLDDLRDVSVHLEGADVEFGFRLRASLLSVDAEHVRDPEFLRPQTSPRRYLTENRGAALLAALGQLSVEESFALHFRERGERFAYYWRGREAAAESAGSVLTTLAESAHELVDQLYSPARDAAWHSGLLERLAAWEERDAVAAALGYLAEPEAPGGATELAALLPHSVAVVDFVSYIAPLERRRQLEVVRGLAERMAAGGKVDLHALQREHVVHALGAYVVVRGGPLRLVYLGELQSIEEAMRRLHASFSGQTREEEKALREADEALLGELWRRLEGAFDGARTIVLRPDTSAQASFPFGVLHPHSADRQVIDDYAIALTPSLPYLRAQLERPPEPTTGRAVLVGGPASFDAYAEMFHSAAFEALVALPDAQEELREVEGILASSGLLPRRIQHATKRDVLRALEEAQVLHVAAHSFPDALAVTRLVSERPSAPALGHEPLRLRVAGRPVPPQALAGIVLAWDARAHGLLTGIELENLRLQGMKLAVLSSCSSALGGSGDREGEALALGLQRSLHLAGCETVVASLWPVHDQAARLLMAEFYRNWFERGLSRIDALRQAQLVLRGVVSGGQPRGVGGVMLDAADWAAFTLSGVWDGR